MQREGALRRARAARDYQDAIKQAERDENVASVFADNRIVALKGERPDPMIVGELLAARVGFQQPKPDGTPVIMANGEAGVVRNPKRPNRNDRRRRRGGMRFTPALAAT